MKEIPMMPEVYRGKTTKNGGYTKSSPRSWTKDELAWLESLVAKGYSAKEIAVSMGRTETSVSIKRKRLGKKQNTYNATHVTEKYKINEEFLEAVRPVSILDVYCGEKSFYKDMHAVTNDINEGIPADYHMDALRLLCRLYCEGAKFDLIDLDPFGSAYDCFDLAIKMADRALVITLGELGHKRWKRLDYVRHHYGIESLNDFTIERLISEIQKIGLRNKKKLEVWGYKEWRNIGRVWFKVSKVKTTEQWDKLKEEDE